MIVVDDNCGSIDDDGGGDYTDDCEITGSGNGDGSISCCSDK